MLKKVFITLFFYFLFAVGFQNHAFADYGTTTIEGKVNIGGLTSPVPTSMKIRINAMNGSQNNIFENTFPTGEVKTPGYSLTNTYTPTSGEATSTEYSVDLYDKTGKQIGHGTGGGNFNIKFGVSNNMNLMVNVVGSGGVPATITCDDSLKQYAAAANIPAELKDLASKATIGCKPQAQCGGVYKAPGSITLPDGSTTTLSCSGSTSGVCCGEIAVAPPTSGTNSCVDVDNDDKAFKCASTCSAPFEKDTRDGQTNFKCTTGVCCVNKAIYDARKKNSPVKPQEGPGGTTPGSTTPGTTTNTPTPNRPEAFPCEFHRGQKSYLGAYCGSADGKTHEQFDPTKAATKAFCSMTYIDAYSCVDGTDDYFPVAGNKTCASAPWCPGPTATPAGPNANCKAYQGQTCNVKADGSNDYSVGIYCCEPNKNLECREDPSGQGPHTCQYINNTPFTPTPGASNTCDAANFGRWGVGCACPAGGGCGGTLGCYPEATGAKPADNPSGQYCATGRWCAKSQTDVQNAAACGTSTTYSTPTPTPKNTSYQADCPNVNPGGLPNACVLGSSCPTNYEQHSSVGTPGGTNGNQACTEFEGGQPSICCTKKAGSTGPAATSAPTPTPSPLSSSSKPAGPNIPFSSVGTCPSGLEGYWKGTYCDTDKSYYDVYCEAGAAKKHAVPGITCQ